MSEVTAPSPTGPSHNSIPDQENHEWHRRAGPVFKFGLATGFALIILGGMSMTFSLASIFVEILLFCSGLSIILGAFGSTAKINIQGQSIVLVGVAAITAILFTVLIEKMDDRYVRIKIKGDIKDSNIELIGDESYFGAPRLRERSYDFIIFGQEIPPNLELYIIKQEEEIPFSCISASAIKPHLASGRTLQWQFDRNKGILLDATSKKVIANVGPCQETKENLFSSLDFIKRRSDFFEIIPSAFANENSLESSANFSFLFEQLKSDISHTRREARAMLANKGPLLVSPAMAYLANTYNDYRIKLGIIVSLTEMIRTNKHNRADIIKTLTEKDLALLIEFAADPDRTIRIYASEFLYDLGDPRAINLAINKLSTTSENGRYNLILVTKGSMPFATIKHKKIAAEQLLRIKSPDTPKTNELIDQVISIAQGM